MSFRIKLLLAVLVGVAIGLIVHLQYTSMVILTIAFCFLTCFAMRRNRWNLALLTITSGATLVFIAYWLIPTPSGLSHYEARMEAHRLLLYFQSGKVDGWTHLVEQRRRCDDLSRQAPWQKDQLRQAEKQVVLAMLAELRQIPIGNFADFQKGLPNHLEFADLFPDLVDSLLQSESTWGEAVVDQEIEGLVEKLATNPLQMAVKLRKTSEALGSCGEQKKAQEKLLIARRLAVNACLNKAKEQTRELIRADRFQAAEILAIDFAKHLAPEAETLGLSAELIQFQAGCSFLAELARRAGKPDPKP